LFAALRGKGLSVVNLADKESRYFLTFPAERYLGFRLADHHTEGKLPREGVEVVAEQMRTGPHGVKFTLDGVRFASPLRGTTNVENLLVSAALAREFGVPLETSAQLAATLPDIPGRIEEIQNNRGLRIVVDYAHTPSALERVYQSVRNDAKQMICVLGAAGGGRDVWKRPELGAIAGKYCDVAIVADEDPYDENPEAIRNAVLEGIRKGKRTRDVRDIADRKAAVGEAISLGKPGDAVVITGKGCEPWMMLAGGAKVAWDDREVVREALEEKDKA
jgi:UDP-N-acetylmuramoyl-L-alanyl-D-glutamate--2,6-diaminopimelate ligase